MRGIMRRVEVLSMGFVMSVCRRMDFTQEDDIVPQKAPERADRGAEE